MADILGKMDRKLYYFHKNSGLELYFVIRTKENVYHWSARLPQEKQNR